MRSPRAQYAVAAAVATLTTAATLPMLGVIDLANIALLYVLAVVLVATFLGRGPAVLSSFLSVAAVDFFFVPPRFSFTVAHTQYLITLVVLLLVSLIISHLSNAYRAKAVEAERKAGESAVLHELATQLSGALTLVQVVERLTEVARRRLQAAVSLSVFDAGGRLVPVLAEPPTGVALSTVTDTERSGATIRCPLRGATREHGVVELRFDGRGATVEPKFLDAVAAVVATAVERIHYVEVAQAGMLDIEAERLRGSILSALSHDLRTPLTVLFGVADALAHGEGLDPRHRATAATLRDQTHRMSRMVDNLLDMARLNSGRLVLRRDWQSLPELVGASVQSMAGWIDLRRLRFEWPGDLPLVELDAVLIERVICNLVENASKYSPPGTPIIIGAQVVDDGAGRFVDMWFDNAGPGFPGGEAGHLFEIFERGAPESAVSGAGVGLAICRAIVAAHCGRIRAFNRDGGARVSVQLPLGKTPPVPDEEEGA